VVVRLTACLFVWMGRRLPGLVALVVSMLEASFGATLSLCFGSLSLGLWFRVSVLLFFGVDYFICYWDFYSYVEIGYLFDDVSYDAYDMAIWRCMLFIRCDVFEKFLVCMLFGIYWRREVYFLNICIIHVFYRFNRSRALQRSNSKLSSYH
jgi:hypothetical protein